MRLRIDRICKAVLLSVAFVTLAGCGQSRQEAQDKAAAGVLFKIDGHGVQAADVRASIEMLPEAPKTALLKDAETLRRFVEEYANKELLYLEALKQGLDKDAEVRRRVAAAEKTILTQYLLDKQLADKVKVTDAEIKKYIEENKDQFTAEEQLKIAHIQFASLKDAQAARARLARGEDFAALAQELSQDPMSRGSGGLLGTVERSKAPPQFAAALAKMKKGEVSDPIRTEHGYHLVKLLDVVPGGMVAIDPIREPLRQFLAQEKQHQALEELVGSLRKRYKLESNPAEIERFVTTTLTEKK